MTLPWYVTALAAALVWGVHYPLIDYALQRLSLLTVLLLTAAPIVLIAPFFYRTLALDTSAWRQLPWTERLPILALMLTSLVGTVLLYLSISHKNATLASLIEISYPVFVALFAFLLFRQVHFTASVVVGALLVFSGVVLIIWRNP
ncbi:MAG: DMT family transporter [Gammaproteobacteria bacterium]|nr:DMT family transporter [Gammaproteobacteria bacterium]